MSEQLAQESGRNPAHATGWRRTNALVGSVLWVGAAAAVAATVVTSWRSVEPQSERTAGPERLVSGVDHRVEVVEDAAGTRKRLTLKLPQPLWDPGGVANFELTDQHGRKIGKSTLLGRPWVVGFIFTRCAGPCPRLTKAMYELLPYAKRAGVRLVTITVDPDYDSPEVLARYADAYGANDEDWLFLTGPKDTVYSLVRGSFLMPVEEVTGPRRKPGFEVVHSTNFLLVDAEGRVVEKFNGQLDEDVVRLKERLREMAVSGSGKRSADAQ